LIKEFPSAELPLPLLLPAELPLPAEFPFPLPSALLPLRAELEEPGERRLPRFSAVLPEPGDKRSPRSLLEPGERMSPREGAATGAAKVEEARARMAVVKMVLESIFVVVGVVWGCVERWKVLLMIV
jgi:hypothetical protein